MSPLDKIAAFGAKLGQVHVPLHAAYVEYAKPSGSDVDLVGRKLEEAASELEALAQNIREWRG